MTNQNFLNLSSICAATIAITVANPVQADNSPACNEGAGSESTECGINSSATEQQGTAVGFSAKSTESYATAIGSNSEASSVFATALGNNAQASGDFSFATGANAIASSYSATAVGASAEASGDYSIAAGSNAVASAYGAIAVGGRAEASGSYSIATGVGAKASNDFSLAAGAIAQATGIRAIAIGVMSVASGNNAVGLGTQATATGSGSSALGSNAKADGDNSVAIGQSSVADQANTVSFGSIGGERRLVNIAAGITDTDAVNVSQLKNTADTALIAKNTADEAVAQNITQNDQIAALEATGAMHGGRLDAAENSIATNTSQLKNVTNAVSVAQNTANEAVAQHITQNDQIAALGATGAMHSGRLDAAENAIAINASQLKNVMNVVSVAQNTADEAVAQNITQNDQITALEATGAMHGGRLDAAENSIAANTSQLKNVTNAVSVAQNTANEAVAQNITQNDQITALEVTGVIHGGRLDAAENTIATQDGRLLSAETSNTMQDTQIAAIHATDATQNGRLASLEMFSTNAISSLQSLTAQQSGQIDALFKITDRDRRDTRSGIAAAIAIADAPMPSQPGRTSYTLNVANFRGEQAVGAALAHRIDTADPFAITAGLSYAGHKNTAVRFGIAGEF